MSELKFLVEGNDGATPLQAYCSVKTSTFMIIDSIYPHPNISICVGKLDNNKQLGDNCYTRNIVIEELIKLDRYFHCVKHFYRQYNAVLNTYSDIEAMEHDRYTKQPFKSKEDRAQYLNQMHQRLRQIYIHYLQRAIHEITITDNTDLVIQPYLLTQILKQLKY